MCREARGGAYTNASNIIRKIKRKIRRFILSRQLSTHKLIEDYLISIKFFNSSLEAKVLFLLYIILK